MTRRVAEKLYTKKVCIDFLAPKMPDHQDHFSTPTPKSVDFLSELGAGEKALTKET